MLVLLVTLPLAAGCLASLAVLPGPMRRIAAFHGPFVAPPKEALP